MQLGNVTTDPTKDYGITFVRQQYNASQSPTVDDGQGNQVPNPALFETDWDYAWARIGAMIAAAVDSWAQQADAAANTPPAGSPGGVTGGNWRPQANTDMAVVRVKLLSILSTMQSDYAARGQTDYVTAVLAVKDAVKVIQNAPGVLAVYDDDSATRAQYDAAVKAAWAAAAAPAPAQVKIDFGIYGGNTVWG